MKVADAALERLKALVSEPAPPTSAGGVVSRTDDPTTVQILRCRGSQHRMHKSPTFCCHRLRCSCGDCRPFGSVDSTCSISRSVKREEVMSTCAHPHLVDLDLEDSAVLRQVFDYSAESWSFLCCCDLLCLLLACLLLYVWEFPLRSHRYVSPTSST